VANATITLSRAASVGQIGTTSANGAGAWTFSYTGTTLSEGMYAFTATATWGKWAENGEIVSVLVYVAVSRSTFRLNW